jgi:broad specificity phosphatase PhoE
VSGKRLFVLARHGQSLLNVAGVVNGDPLRDPGLSVTGVEEARELGRQISGVAVQLVVVSPFPRTAQTAEVALEGRGIRRIVDDDLGDIRIGELEGKTVADYRAAKAHTDHSVSFPGGESLNEAARRYAQAFERLLARGEPFILVVSHEMAVRYAVNAAGGGHDLDSPLHTVSNARPYVFDEPGLQRAVTRMRELAC